MWARSLLLCWRLLSWCGAAQVGEPVPAPARHCRRPHSCRQDSETDAYRTALVLDLSIWALWGPLAPCLSFLSGPEVGMSHPFLFDIDHEWLTHSVMKQHDSENSSLIIGSDSVLFQQRPMFCGYHGNRNMNISLWACLSSKCAPKIDIFILRYWKIKAPVFAEKRNFCMKLPGTTLTGW